MLSDKRVILSVVAIVIIVACGMSYQSYYDHMKQEYTHQVKALFQDHLERDADRHALQLYVGIALHDGSIDKVESAIRDSDEAHALQARKQQKK